MRCPECRSTRLVKFGKKFARNPETGRRHRVQQYQCKNCGRITIYPRK
jgi:transposase-like protein